jgi:hypothetical protein
MHCWGLFVKKCKAAFSKKAAPKTLGKRKGEEREIENQKKTKRQRE